MNYAKCSLFFCVMKDLRTLRKGEGLTLRQLSARTGITTANLHHIEAGKFDPKRSTLEAILDALGWELILQRKPKRVEWCS
jgi:predicted transcriptional regulator